MSFRRSKDSVIPPPPFVLNKLHNPVSPPCLPSRPPARTQNLYSPLVSHFPNHELIKTLYSPCTDKIYPKPLSTFATQPLTLLCVRVMMVEYRKTCGIYGTSGPSPPAPRASSPSSSRPAGIDSSASARHSLHVLLRRWCLQMLAPPHSAAGVDVAESHIPGWLEYFVRHSRSACCSGRATAYFKLTICFFWTNSFSLLDRNTICDSTFGLPTASVSKRKVALCKLWIFVSLTKENASCVSFGCVWSCEKEASSNARSSIFFVFTSIARVQNQ